MELNDKNLEALAAGLKVSKEDLVKAITEKDVELKLPEHIYTEEEYQILDKNIYHKGKKAASEMDLKEAIKQVSTDYKVETEGIKDFNSLIGLVATSKDSHYKTLLKEGASKDNQELIAKLEANDKDLTTLRQQIIDNESDFKTQILEKETKYASSQIDNVLISVSDSIPFDIPKHVLSQGKEAEMKFIQTEKSKYLTLMKNTYTFDISEGNLIVSKDGNVIKDSLQSPAKITDIALEFAKSMNFNLKTKNLNREKGSKLYGSDFQGMEREDFNSLMAEKGHKVSSKEYLTYYGEYKKANE